MRLVWSARAVRSASSSTRPRVTTATSAASGSEARVARAAATLSLAGGAPASASAAREESSALAWVTRAETASSRAWSARPGPEAILPLRAPFPAALALA